MPEFVKYGTFSRYHLIWWSVKDGYFVTDPYGVSFSGERRVPLDVVQAATGVSAA